MDARQRSYWRNKVEEADATEREEMVRRIWARKLGTTPMPNPATQWTNSHTSYHSASSIAA